MSQKIKAGEMQWQVDILKSQDMDTIFKKCTEELKKLLKDRDTLGIYNESDIEDEAISLLIDNLEQITCCNCGPGCDCVFPEDNMINAIISWYNVTKKALTSYDTTD